MKNNNLITRIIIVALFIIIPLAGCATTAMETHQKGMESLTEKEYFIPKRPVDRHFIGCAWSRQFGPVQDSSCSGIQIKVERSFDAMQQSFAYNAGISLAGQSHPNVGITIEKDQGQVLKLNAKSIKGEAGIEGGKASKSELEYVEIITPVSIADIPFEPTIPYITEALRLGNFLIRSEAAGKAGAAAEMDTIKGVITGEASSGGSTGGHGLVVAYKLHEIAPETYTSQESGSISLELNKTIEIPAANLYVKPQLRVIDVGANKPLPRNLLWACDQADARSRNIIAAWIIELRSKDPRRKSLQIAFPAFPKMDDCQNYSGVIFSRIDPRTDRIIRQKINITLVQEEVSDGLQPLKWEAKMNLVDESFKIRLVKQDDLNK